jgi:pyrroline-5-carboxylate reductase
MKQPDPVAFIGGGNMARSFIAGLLADGADAHMIRVSEPIDSVRDALHRDFGVQVFADNRDAVDGAGCWVLAATGQVVWLTDEDKMDAVTAVSGTGPAYVFLLAESMLAAAQSQGLPSDAARVLVRQTLLGAARMLVQDDGDPGDLRRRVTSPGGTTQAAMEVLQDGAFDALVARAIGAATERGRELSAVGESTGCLQ